MQPNNSDLEELIHTADIVVFRTALTDLGGLERDLDDSGYRWREIKLEMADKASRERYETLRQMTEHFTLPQVFFKGRFIGGIEATRTLLQENRQASHTATKKRSTAWPNLMAYGSLIPIVGLAAYQWSHAGAFASAVLAVYMATVLAFIGAVHWGWAMSDPDGDFRRFMWGCIPAILGWILACLPSIVSLPLLMIAVVLIWYGERRFWGIDKWPNWYRAQRTQLTMATTLCIFATWIALLK